MDQPPNFLANTIRRATLAAVFFRRWQIMTSADIYREAFRVIQDCGADYDPKAFAFAQSSLFHQDGDFKEAARWAEIANAIDMILHDVTTLDHVPKALH